MEKTELISKFMENEYWHEEYETAPSDACREYIEYQWLNGHGHTDEEKAALEVTKASMTATDWEHLMKYAGNTPFKTYCRERLEELREV